MSVDQSQVASDATVTALLDGIQRQLRLWTIATPALIVFGAVMTVVADDLPGVVFGVVIAPLPLGLAMIWYLLLLRRFLPPARAAIAVGGRAGTVTAVAVTGYYGARQIRLDLTADGQALSFVPPWRRPRQWTSSEVPATVYGGRMTGDPVLVACAAGAAGAVLGKRSGWTVRSGAMIGKATSPAARRSSP
jgi:hypothetical protein